ncbi:MAG: hypothetical protein AAB320_00365 [Elusimicrobiota bacterium]
MKKMILTRRAGLPVALILCTLGTMAATGSAQSPVDWNSGDPVLQLHQRLAEQTPAAVSPTGAAVLETGRPVLDLVNKVAGLYMGDKNPDTAVLEPDRRKNQLRVSSWLQKKSEIRAEILEPVGIKKGDAILVYDKIAPLSSKILGVYEEGYLYFEGRSRWVATSDYSDTTAPTYVIKKAEDIFLEVGEIDGMRAGQAVCLKEDHDSGGDKFKAGKKGKIEHVFSNGVAEASFSPPLNIVRLPLAFLGMKESLFLKIADLKDCSTRRKK